MSVRIAIVDSGADVSAPDIAAKQPLTYNAIDNSRDVTDTVGHRTFVASLAAGSASNSEGVAGIAGEARLIAIKASGAGMFTDFELAAAVAYAVDNGAKVINLSLGGTRSSLTEVRALQYAAAKDMLVVAAAGNEKRSGEPRRVPGRIASAGRLERRRRLRPGRRRVDDQRRARRLLELRLVHLPRGTGREGLRRDLEGLVAEAVAARRAPGLVEGGSTGTAAARRSPRPRWPAPQRSCGRPTRR